MIKVGFQQDDSIVALSTSVAPAASSHYQEINAITLLAAYTGIHHFEEDKEQGGVKLSLSKEIDFKLELKRIGMNIYNITNRHNLGNIFENAIDFPDLDQPELRWIVLPEIKKYLAEMNDNLELLPKRALVFGQSLLSKLNGILQEIDRVFCSQVQYLIKKKSIEEFKLYWTKSTPFSELFVKFNDIFFQLVFISNIIEIKTHLISDILEKFCKITTQFSSGSYDISDQKDIYCGCLFRIIYDYVDRILNNLKLSERYLGWKDPCKNVLNLIEFLAETYIVSTKIGLMACDIPKVYKLLLRYEQACEKLVNPKKKQAALCKLHKKYLIFNMYTKNLKGLVFNYDFLMENLDTQILNMELPFIGMCMINSFNIILEKNVMPKEDILLRISLFLRKINLAISEFSAKNSKLLLLSLGLSIENMLELQKKLDILKVVRTKYILLSEQYADKQIVKPKKSKPIIFFKFMPPIQTEYKAPLAVLPPPAALPPPPPLIPVNTTVRIEASEIDKDKQKKKQDYLAKKKLQRKMEAKKAPAAKTELSDLSKKKTYFITSQITPAFYAVLNLPLDTAIDIIKEAERILEKSKTGYSGNTIKPVDRDELAKLKVPKTVQWNWKLKSTSKNFRIYGGPDLAGSGMIMFSHLDMRPHKIKDFRRSAEKSTSDDCSLSSLESV